jgi:hypothetical protein
MRLGAEGVFVPRKHDEEEQKQQDPAEPLGANECTSVRLSLVNFFVHLCTAVDLLLGKSNRIETSRFRQQNDSVPRIALFEAIVQYVAVTQATLFIECMILATQSFEGTRCRARTSRARYKSCKTSRCQILLRRCL